MSALRRVRRLAVAVPLLCTLGLGGCSLDFLFISLCATEQQGFSIDGPSSFASSQGGVSVAVGDSVRLVGHGSCHDGGLHVVIAASSTEWHSRDDAIVRISPGPDSSAADGGALPTAWAVGVAAGSTVVLGDFGGTVASVAVEVTAR